MKNKIAVLACLAVLASVVPARAATDEGVTVGSRAGVSLGGRAMYFRAKDADDGSLNGGAQLRVHLGPVFAIEGSADFRQDKFGGTTVDSIPAQASLLAYLFPGQRLSPYILGGAGWYYTHVQSPYDSTTHRFGPHAGAGVEWFLNRHWSVDADGRYVWLSRFRTQDAAHPLGRDINPSGYMLTAGLNYFF